MKPPSIFAKGQTQKRAENRPKRSQYYLASSCQLQIKDLSKILGDTLKSQGYLPSGSVKMASIEDLKPFEKYV